MLVLLRQITSIVADSIVVAWSHFFNKECYFCMHRRWHLRKGTNRSNELSESLPRHSALWVRELNCFSSNPLCNCRQRVYTRIKQYSHVIISHNRCRKDEYLEYLSREVVEQRPIFWNIALATCIRKLRKIITCEYAINRLQQYRSELIKKRGKEGIWTKLMLFLYPQHHRARDKFIE